MEGMGRLAQYRSQWLELGARVTLNPKGRKTSCYGPTKSDILGSARLVVDTAADNCRRVGVVESCGDVVDDVV